MILITATSFAGLHGCIFGKPFTWRQTIAVIARDRNVIARDRKTMRNYSLELKNHGGLTLQSILATNVPVRTP